MDKKEDMLKEGFKSPDIIDAMSFAFLEGATFMVAEGYTALGVDERRRVAREEAETAFDDIE
jgi:hypothetical protein